MAEHGAAKAKHGSAPPRNGYEAPRYARQRQRTAGLGTAKAPPSHAQQRQSRQNPTFNRVGFFFSSIL